MGIFFTEIPLMIAKLFAYWFGCKYGAMIIASADKVEYNFAHRVFLVALLMPLINTLSEEWAKAFS